MREDLPLDEKVIVYPIPSRGRMSIKNSPSRYIHILSRMLRLFTQNPTAKTDPLRPAASPRVTSSYQFIQLQTGSMDVSGKVVQYRFTLVGTKSSSSPSFPNLKEEFMKTVKWTLPVMLLLLSGLMAAQSLTSSHVVAQVPFDFMVNNKIIPAGECEVGSVGMDGKILAIRNFDARKAALANSSQDQAKQAADSTVLVFKHYGNQYFLSEIRLEGSNGTYKLPESRAEAELRAQNAPASQQTLLASLK